MGKGDETTFMNRLRLFENGLKIGLFTRADLTESLRRHAGEAPPADLVTSDYCLCRDLVTGLEYAEPRLPGSSSFYEWLGRFPWYYPAARPEFGQVLDLIGELGREGGTVRVADVGCGSGEFVAQLHGRPRVEVLGVEPSGPACATCRKRGLDVFQGTALDLLTTTPRPPSFDLVCSFHTLEHVPDPAQFVRELFDLAGERAVVCVSTPLSPMFFEIVWFDVLNHPPHHLTRWTLAAYRALARELNLEAEFRFPPPVSLLRQVWVCCSLKYFGPSRSVSRARRLSELFLRPIATATIAWKLLRQRRERPESRWDSVLVLLRRSANSPVRR